MGLPHFFNENCQCPGKLVVCCAPHCCVSYGVESSGMNNQLIEHMATNQKLTMHYKTRGTIQVSFGEQKYVS